MNRYGVAGFLSMVASGVLMAFILWAFVVATLTALAA